MNSTLAQYVDHTYQIDGQRKPKKANTEDKVFDTWSEMDMEKGRAGKARIDTATVRGKLERKGKKRKEKAMAGRTSAGPAPGMPMCMGRLIITAKFHPDRSIRFPQKLRFILVLCVTFWYYYCPVLSTLSIRP